MRVNPSPKKRIPVTYWKEIKLTGELVSVFGVLKSDTNKVYILEVW